MSISVLRFFLFACFCSLAGIAFTGCSNGNTSSLPKPAVQVAQGAQTHTRAPKFVNGAGDGCLGLVQFVDPTQCGYVDPNGPCAACSGDPSDPFATAGGPSGAGGSNGVKVGTPGGL